MSDSETVPGRTDPALPEIPDVQLRAEIARGGMGVVYRGRQDFLDRDVAVKLLSSHLQGDHFTARFRREAKILAGIKHPHIVSCHTAGTTPGGQCYLVMEFVDGPNLKSWIADNGTLPLDAALRLTRQLASALGHAHEQDVIHRDVKPENILLESPTSTSIDLAFPYVPKLVDLGLARMGHEVGDLGLTAPGSVMGTPATMAPEQFDAPDAVDFRADIYGLGGVLYEMLTGARAFESTQLTDIVIEKRKERGPDPCDKRADLPAGVGALVSQMMACDPADRPASYRALIERLDGLARDATRAPARTARADQPLLQTAEFAFLAGSDAPPVPQKAPDQPLLQTAELAFLGGEPIAGAAPEPLAFPDPTGVHERIAAAARPETEPAAPTPPRRRGRRVLVLGAVAVAFFLTGVAVLKKAAKNRRQDDAHPAAPAARPAPKTTSPAGLAIGGLDGEVRPDVDLALRAQLPAAPGAGLRYRWTVEPSAAGVLATPEAAGTDLRLEGLPGDAITIGLSVEGAGGTPLRAERKLVLDYAPRDLLADILDNDTKWATPGRARPRAGLERADDGAVSFVALLVPCIRTREIPGRVWRVSGELRSEKGGKAFAQTAICVRISTTRFLAITCDRTGGSGEQWTAQLQRVTRSGRNGLTFRPAGEQPKSTMLFDRARTLTGVRYTITRRDDELVFDFGFAGGETMRHVDRVRARMTETQVILYASGGRGVFRKLEMW